jgi:alcohol dehydrogenase class IV
MSLLPENLLLPQQTVAKAGSALGLVPRAAPFGSAGVIVHGASLRRSGALEAILGQQPVGMALRTWQHDGGEPTVAAVEALRTELRRDRPDWVAAVGGGSVIDLAKAAVALVDATETAAFYQTNNDLLPPATLPLVAVPTTAGTGSEATVVAVLTDPERRLKQSIRHPSYMPKLAILDADLLTGCPPFTIATAGLDAFIQAFESYTSRHATPFTRALSELALVHIAHGLLPLYRGDLRFASDMLESSYVCGLALSHARLGVVHGLAHPLGARTGVAHGLLCALCFPACLAFNQAVIQRNLEDLKTRHGIDVQKQVHEWLSAMQLPNPLADAHIADRDAMIGETLASGSTAANPRPVSADDAAAIFDAILGP